MHFCNHKPLPTQPWRPFKWVFMDGFSDHITTDWLLQWSGHTVESLAHQLPIMTEDREMSIIAQSVYCNRAPGTETLDINERMGVTWVTRA